jgi:hydrogenase expression/formation protein HypC
LQTIRIGLNNTVSKQGKVAYMCLGIPGKITEVYEQDSLKMAKVDFGGISKEACLAYTPEAEVGQYALIHVGFAISLMDEEEAQETLKLIQEMSDIEREIST